MITSSSNERIKQVRKLRDRKYRDENSLAYIEGIRIVREAIDQNVEIEMIITSESFEYSSKKAEINSLITRHHWNNVTVQDDVFKSLSTKERPQGIGAVIKQSWCSFTSFTEHFAGLWVCLWEIADPGNLGTIIRTVDAVGARGILLLGNCTDPYDTNAIRGSMGALFSRDLVKSDLNTAVDWIKENRIYTYGTSDAAKVHYRDVRYSRDMLLLMGSERQGLPETLKGACTEMVRIPMCGTSDSLNLAVATGVILYEILDQHELRVKR